MNGLWTASEAIEATGGTTLGDWVATGISIDTRTLSPGDLFVALSDRRDGHDFVADALASGAAAALVSRVPDGVGEDAPLLLVADVQKALEALAGAARKRTEARVIAVTGSVGKTSTKDMLAHVLSRQGKTHAAVMSLNNHWGVPLTLARMPRDCDFAVIEIGMNHAGEITPLSCLARPNVALVTTVAEAHMAAFSSLDEIARAKAELFDGLERGGTAVLNRDDATHALLAASAGRIGVRIVGFGTQDRADYVLRECRIQAESCIVRASIDGATCLFKIGAPGRHLAMNALSVLAAIEAVGADMAVAALDLADWHPPAGRGQRLTIRLDPVEESQTLELIDDAYNANPASMASAFEVLAASQPVDGRGRIRRGRRIAFLSDMLELGAEAAQKHRALCDLAAMAQVDTVHCAGALMKNLIEALPAEKRGEWHATAETLGARVHHLLDAGDVVLVKGSKGSRAALVVDAIKKLAKADP
ncbi:MAG: UDP-N-acetylmuramoyl-tripeptide--D-alanyl-D-alanine ligase [Paracoccaceae bacterium]